MEVKTRTKFYEDAQARSQQFFVGDKYYEARAVFLRNHCVSVLDVGCGDGSFMRFCEEAGLRCRGVEISRSAVSLARQNGLNVDLTDIDTQDFPFETGSFDGLFCGEVLEHVFDTDHLLSECFRVLKSEGDLVVTTPNLASWFNRLFLLFGYQPLFTEVSLSHGVGHPFPFWLGAGHLRIFTLRALQELLAIHGFAMVRTTGFGINPNLGYGKRFQPLARIANAIFRKASLSSDLFIVAKKRDNVERK
jgi:methionine biosynthesis protein MetW